MMENLVLIDTNITNLINILLPHNSFFDYFFSFFSLRGNSFFIWAGIIILVLIFEERKHPGISKRDFSFISIFIISFLVSSFISQILIKNIVRRERPCHITNIDSKQEAVKKIKCLEDFSFPSSHATTAFAASTVIAYFDKKRLWFYLLIAVLISLSRIYLGYHYFFDVLCGACLGLIIAVTLLKFRKKSL